MNDTRDAISMENGKETNVLLEKEVRCQNETKKNAEQSKENQSDILIWNKKVPNTELERFTKIIEDKYKLHFNSYWDLHKWTVDYCEKFWEDVWTHFGIVFSKPYDKVLVKTGPGILDNKWFPGAEFNYAENLLKFRDNREALVCLDEEGNLERVTFAQMFEEVKLYAAAFRKHGLQKGDTVAGYMSNKKEAVFAMLAATSIGAIFGGPYADSGVKTAANVIQMMDAKFLIVMEGVKDECSGEEHNLIDNLPLIAKSKHCFLEDFLASGKTPDGEVPDIVFEQLPFDHPVSVTFSSGTTGRPKAPVHSAGSILCPLVDFGLNYNLKSGDTLYCCFSMGWSIWHYFVPTISLGVRLFLDSSVNFNLTGSWNIWDIISEHNISFAGIVASIADRMEKMNLRPKQSATYKNLQWVVLGGGPVKVQNYKYLKGILKEDVFIGNFYGSSELHGTVSCCDLNSPCYACEVQVFALGKDVKVFDKKGQPVVDEKGEVVIMNPLPTFPIHFLKDNNNELLNRIYVSKFPGVWQQHDEACINPKTKGMLVMGRSDDILYQDGERFESSDIYFAIHDMKEIEDYICVGQRNSKGYSRAVLFLKLREGEVFTPEFRKKVAKKIESELWLECVPELILEVKGIPYNSSNKRVESVIKKILATNQIPQEVNIKNPECLEQYCNIPEIVTYKDNCESR